MKGNGDKKEINTYNLLRLEENQITDPMNKWLCIGQLMIFEFHAMIDWWQSKILGQSKIAWERMIDFSWIMT